MVGVVREACVRGLPARRTGKAADALGLASPVPSRVSRTAADLDGEVAAPGARRLGGMAFPYPWPGATYPDCRDEGHVRSRGVAAAIACGEDGSRRLVGFGPASPARASRARPSASRLSFFPGRESAELGGLGEATGPASVSPRAGIRAGTNPRGRSRTRRGTAVGSRPPTRPSPRSHFPRTCESPARRPRAPAHISLWFAGGC
ncbi:transposase [Olsenella uli]|uniref:transposase n=1 Tax=Olsenella uli TaxID=133926 RepID=UPI0009D71B79